MDPHNVKKLICCENPFRWNVRSDFDDVPPDMIQILSEQLIEKKPKKCSDLQIIVIYLNQAYEYDYENLIDDALEAVFNAEDYYQKVVDNFVSVKLQQALNHIIFSTKACLLLKKDDTDEAIREIISKITDLSQMNIESAAALYGLRALFTEKYGTSALKLCLTLTSKAIALDPKEAYWYLLKGKYLSRIRRRERPFDVPTKEEKECLEQAVRGKAYGLPTILISELYRDTSRVIYKNYHKHKFSFPEIRMQLETLNKKSFEMLQNSTDTAFDSPRTMFRCAKGYMFIPHPYRNVNLAKQLLDKGLEKAPDSGFGNHTMAQYYEQVEKDMPKTLEYLKKCEPKKIFSATIDMIRVEYKITGKLDVEKLEKLLTIFTTVREQCMIYSHLIAYYILIANDLNRACDYVTKVIHLDYNTNIMTRYRPIYTKELQFVNLYELFVDEIKIATKNLKYKCRNYETYRKMLVTLFSIGVPVSFGKPMFLKDEIMSAGDTFEKKIQFTDQRKRYPNENPRTPQRQAGGSNDAATEQQKILDMTLKYSKKFESDLKDEASCSSKTKLGETSNLIIENEETRHEESDDSDVAERMKIYHSTKRLEPSKGKKNKASNSSVAKFNESNDSTSNENQNQSKHDLLSENKATFEKLVQMYRLEKQKATASCSLKNENQKNPHQASQNKKEFSQDHRKNNQDASRPNHFGPPNRNANNFGPPNENANKFGPPNRNANKFGPPNRNAYQQKFHGQKKASQGFHKRYETYEPYVQKGPSSYTR